MARPPWVSPKSSNFGFTGVVGVVVGFVVNGLSVVVVGLSVVVVVGLSVVVVVGLSS
ncbi:MAG: hypothetical protein R3E08_00215 [Thiotrichaceae bacterium]